MYCVRADIESFFGVVPVGKWADLDGDADATKIAARIAAAIEWAGNEIDATLRGGPYPVPFTTPYPHHIHDLCVKLAGTYMYSARGAEDTDADGEAMDRYAPIRNKCEKRLAAILSGQLDLGITTTARTVPLVRRVALEDHDITATTLP